MRLEDQLQIACVEWYRIQYRGMLITSFPAGYVFGGSQTQRMITGRRMKEMGYQNGMPDLFIPYPRGGEHGLFLELKTEKGRLSHEQKEIHQILKDEGYECVVIRSLDEFIRVVTDYLKGGKHAGQTMPNTEK